MIHVSTEVMNWDERKSSCIHQGGNDLTELLVMTQPRVPRVRREGRAQASQNTTKVAPSSGEQVQAACHAQSSTKRQNRALLWVHRQKREGPLVLQTEHGKPHCHLLRSTNSPSFQPEKLPNILLPKLCQHSKNNLQLASSPQFLSASVIVEQYRHMVAYPPVQGTCGFPA